MNGNVNKMVQEKTVEYEEIRSGKRHGSNPSEWNPISLSAAFPEKGITLDGGLFTKLFEENIAHIKKSFCEKDFCTDTTWIEALYDLEGNGWYPWLPASNDGRVMGGAANALRWTGDSELKHIVENILERIITQQRKDGYYNYYPESDSFSCHDLPEDSEKRKLFSERKNYDRVFWTRGMIAAGKAGFSEAYDRIRAMYDWLEASEEHLPYMLMGYNATNGVPGGPLVYDTPVGKPEDIVMTQRFFDQRYWMQALINRVPEAFSDYPGERPHCYELLILEAMADEYIATGEKAYLDALLGGWEVFRNGYQHIGGAVAICEGGGPYPYGSFYITTGHNGETCGSVFWIWVNQRLLRLFPNEEQYASEIEKELYNVLAACRTSDGRCRYHNLLHGHKEKGDFAGSCCEVSSTLLLSDLPAYLYMQEAEGITVNLFAASTFANDRLCFRTETDFPYKNEVSITITKAADDYCRLKIRVPNWNTREMAIYINNEVVAVGTPGHYVVLKHRFIPGDKITFSLSPELRPVAYKGWDALPGENRFALLFGPVLMAYRGDFLPEETPCVSLDIHQPNLGFSDKGNLHFASEKEKTAEWVPYFEIEQETFTCLPKAQNWQY